MIVQAIIMVATGVLIGGVGYLIRVRGMLNLLAGYDERKVTDRAGLQRFAGNGVLTLGAILITGGVLVALTSSWGAVATTVIFATWIIFLIATAWLVLGAMRYSKRG